jgi:hypothetical protein
MGGAGLDYRSGAGGHISKISMSKAQIFDGGGANAATAK